MNQKVNPPEQQIMQFILGKWISKPIYVAAKLGIADILTKGNKNIEELAEMTTKMADPLYRMMRALASVGIFTETKYRVFENTPLSECLKQDRLKSAALMFESDWHSNIWNNLLYSIQTGKPSFEKVFGKSAFEWFENNPKEAKVFNEANSFKAVFSHRIIVERYDFSRINTLTDVGGGLGGLMIEILKANSHMKGTVAELPNTACQVTKIIEENKLKNRMNAVTCNFFKEIPGNSDAYLLSHILHDWSDEKCIIILENCRKVMDFNGKLIIVEGIIPPDNEFSMSKLLDLEVLLMGGGRERTENEFGKLLKKTGFKLSEVVQTDGDISIITGIPE